ncbi:MAG: N-acetyltransferase [Proteobacteria bacterium]|nr:N-acetyltransferase [Pseudomonadota bacterium]
MSRETRLATRPVRPATPADAGAIHQIVTAAFAREDEARLVQLIVERGQVLISLVALSGDEAVGHVLVSPIELSERVRCAGIAPLSVLPVHQGMGFGSALMFEAIAVARGLNFDALFLLGNPDYYHRFGFTTAQVGNEYGATDAFMQLELRPGCLQGVSGTARYVSAFNEVSV